MSQNELWGSHLFTSESVSMGHPDKVSDQISDALLDSLIRHDPMVRVAIETLVTTNYAMVAGEVTTHNEKAADALKNAEKTVRETIRRIGYTDDGVNFSADTCEFVSRIHAQSPDISQGVTKGTGLHAEQGAGDQGLMFGFACDETPQLMPLPIHLSHRLVEELANVRMNGKLAWLRPDSKSQVTVRYEGAVPTALHTIVISTQHTEEALDKANPNLMADDAKKQIIEQVIRSVVERECPALWSEDIIFHINPTGKFVIGGPDGDCGLTGRKVIVDTYGGRGPPTWPAISPRISWRRSWPSSARCSSRMPSAWQSPSVWPSRLSGRAIYPATSSSESCARFSR